MKRAILWLGFCLALLLGVVLTVRPPFDNAAESTVLSLPPVIVLWSIVVVFCAFCLTGLAVDAAKASVDEEE